MDKNAKESFGKESFGIASSLTDNELAAALSGVLAARWDDWDLSPFMTYLVDICAPAALPYLADQFDIDGLRGFEMAGDEEQQRDLIKQSIALHKFIGTPWAIREACATIGFPIVLLDEGVTVPGTEPQPEDWAKFRILIEAAMDRHITAEEARKLRLFVEFYKNERSHLIEMGFYQSLYETLFRPDQEDRDSLTVEVITLELSPNPAELNPAGEPVEVQITTNVVWKIPTLIYWGDGTNDRVNITHSGQPGTSRITIFSSENTTGIDRTINAYIQTPGGITIGVLTIIQWGWWHNAYSFDYDRSYNEHSPQQPYITLSKHVVWIESTADIDEPIDVKSNTDWHIERK